MNTETFFKYEILNPKNQVLRKSTPVSSHNLINANHRQISLAGTNHYNSKLSKVIELEEKNHSIF